MESLETDRPLANWCFSSYLIENFIYRLELKNVCFPSSIKYF